MKPIVVTDLVTVVVIVTAATVVNSGDTVHGARTATATPTSPIMITVGTEAVVEVHLTMGTTAAISNIPHNRNTTVTKTTHRLPTRQPLPWEAVR
jgi:hypothetical protein